MNIIFLDIDGVLVTDFRRSNSEEIDGELYHKFNEECVSNLNDLVKDTNSKIVVSSTWRHFGIDALRKIFKHNNIESDILDITPTETLSEIGHLFMGDKRGNQIERWIIENSDPEIINYVIIDDFSDFLDNQIPRFVKTFINDGFTKSDLELAKKILKGQQ